MVRDRATTLFGLGLVLVAIYFVLRTVAAPDVVLLGWTAAAVAIALVSPLAGLTVLAAIGPFTEALTADGRITAAPFLVAALGASLVVHVALNRPTRRPSWPLLMAMAIMAATALGVTHTAFSYGTTHGIDALEAWVPGIGGGLTVLLVAAWCARRGEVRPLLVVVASLTLAGVVSVVDFATTGQVQHSPFGWLLRESIEPSRLQGVLSAPNAAAAIFVVGLAITVAALLYGHSREVRVLAGLASGGLLVALLATYSRSGILALLVVLALLALRWRQRVGMLLMALVVIAAVLIASGALVIRGVPALVDQQRLDAWRAGVEMWLAAPLTGQGFRAFEWLHAQFGSVLDAPHNEWLRLFVEEGLVAGVLGLLLAAAILVRLLSSSEWLAYACGAAAAALFLMASFNNPFIYIQVTAPAFLVVGTGLGLATARGTGGMQRATIRRCT